MRDNALAVEAQMFCAVAILLVAFEKESCLVGVWCDRCVMYLMLEPIPA